MLELKAEEAFATTNKLQESEGTMQHFNSTVSDQSSVGAYARGDGAHSLVYYRARKRLPGRATYMRGGHQ